MSFTNEKLYSIAITVLHGNAEIEIDTTPDILLFRKAMTALIQSDHATTEGAWHGHGDHM